jgi:hypothetical protein
MHEIPAIIMQCFLVLDETSAADKSRTFDAPKFTTKLETELRVGEGQSAHFQAKLTPTDDPNLKVFPQSYA